MASLTLLIVALYLIELDELELPDRYGMILSGVKV